MIIKKDNKFTINWDPFVIETIELEKGKTYLETFSQKIYRDKFEVYQYLYDEEGNRLPSPYVPPYNLVCESDE